MDKHGSSFQSCPTSYTFDNCAAEVGSDDCGFVEDPADNLDWVIAKGNFVSHIYFDLQTGYKMINFPIVLSRKLEGNGYVVEEWDQVCFVGVRSILRFYLIQLYTLTKPS